MTLREKPRTRSQRPHSRRAVRASFVFAWHWPLVCLLLIACLLACVGSAAAPPTARLNFAVDQLPLGVALRDTYGFERNSAGTYVWTKPRSLLILPVEQPGRYRLTLALQSDPTAGSRLVRVFADGALLGAVLPDVTLRDYTFDWGNDSGGARPGASEVRVELETAPYSPPGDARPLGIILSRVALEPVVSASESTELLTVWLGLAVGLLLLGQLGGVPWPWRATALAVVVAVAFGAVLRDRAAALQLASRPLAHPWLLFHGIALAALAALVLGPLGRAPVRQQIAGAGGVAVTPAARRKTVSWRRALDLCIVALPILWAAVVVGLTTTQAAAAWETLAPLLRFDPRRAETVQFAAIVFGYFLLGSGAIRALKPTLTLPTLVACFVVGCAALAVGAGALGDVALLLVLVAAWYELGRYALVLLGVRSRGWEAFVLAFAGGSGLFALWVLLVGALGLLYLPAILIPLFVLIASLGGRWFLAWRSGAVRASLARWPVRARWIPSWFETLLLGQTLGFVLLGWVAGLGPEVLSDAYRVHLVIARQYVEEHRVFAFAEQSLTYWPIHGQLLYATGMLLSGPLLAKLIHTVTGIVAIVGVGVGGAQLSRSRTGGILAAALFASLPLVTWELGIGYADLFETLYGVAALICLLRFVVSRDWRWSFLLGLMLGFGVAAKLRSGFRVVAAFLAAAIGVVGRLPLRSAPRALTAFACGGLLAGGGWVLRTVWLTGSLPGLAPLFAVLGTTSSSSADPITELLVYGIGRSASSLVRLPWELTRDSSLFGEQSDGFIGFALLFLLPCLLALPRRRRVFAALVFVAVPFYLWFTSIQYARYLLPSFAALATVLGAAVVHLGRRLARYRAGGLVVGRFHAAALSGVMLCSIIFYFATFLVYPGSLPTRVVLGQEEPAAYLAHTLGAYEATAYLDRLVAPGTAVAALPDGPGLYTRARLITPFRVTPRLIYATTPAELLEVLRSYGITYLMIEHAAVPPSWAGFLIVRPDFLARYTDRVFVSDSAAIYRLRASGVGASGGELLRDPGFEDASGDAAPWRPIGDAPVPPIAAPAHQGRHAIAVEGRAGYYQTTVVQGGQGYRLQYAARSDQPGTLADLRIDWFNSAGHLVESSVSAVRLSPEWADYSLWRPAPAEATTAVVYILARNQTTCWFDDYSLTPAD